MFKAFALQPLATKVEQITSQKKKSHDYTIQQ